MLSAYPLAFSILALLLPTYASPLPNRKSERIDVNYYGKRSPDVTVLTSLLSSRVVYNPHIKKPAEGDEWKIGSRVRVIWFVPSANFFFAFFFV